jgi:hypothetical protein
MSEGVPLHLFLGRERRLEHPLCFLRFILIVPVLFLDIISAEDLILRFIFILSFSSGILLLLLCQGVQRDVRGTTLACVLVSSFS